MSFSKNIILIFAVLFTACTHKQTSGYKITGIAVAVIDGDTIKIRGTDKELHKIRFADIDAPESKQPFGQQSKQFLSDLVFNKQVTADCREKDRYGRNVCTVYVDGVDTNKALVENGLAWVYEQYKYNKRDDLPYLQAQAKAAKVGLWSAPEAQIINPSDWRKGKRGVQEQVQQRVQQQSQSADYTCGSKKYCKQMSSCDEAQFYLKQCGVNSLDRDGDGTPCESLCR